MKRIAALIAAVLLAAAGLHAQVGIIGGYTSSDMKKAKTGNASMYHVGVAYKAKVPLVGITLQPSLQYSVKGAKTGDDTFKANYLELPVDIQWGMDLILLRPYLMVSPFVGYRLGRIKGGLPDELRANLNDAVNRLEYGLGLGGGLEVMDFVQLSVQYYWNFGHLMNDDKVVGNILQELVGKGNFSGVKVSAALFF